jgi:hypothetical protein
MLFMMAICTRKVEFVMTEDIRVWQVDSDNNFASCVAT